MKSLICFFTFNIFLLSALSAQITLSEMKELLKKNVTIDTIEYLIGRDEFSMHNLNLRIIDGSHRQLNGEFQDDNGTYNFVLQENEKGIYLAVINQSGYKDSQQFIDNLFLFIDSSGFQNFTSIHHKVYGAGIDTNALKKLQFNEYGIACGFNGTPTEKFATMKRLCLTKSIETLRKWVQNFDYETKILGATGLLILEQKGFKLNAIDKKVIGHLKILNIPVNYCAGCTKMPPEYSLNLLSKKSISWFKDF